MDGAAGVMFVYCAQCKHRFERSPDSPNSYSLAGVVALMGGSEPEWQYIGLWQDRRFADLYGLDHYRRRPKRAPAPTGRSMAPPAPEYRRSSYSRSSGTGRW